MQEVSTILGPDGRPIKKAVLTQEHAGPTIGGVRNVWRENVAKGLNPVKLANILRAADEGDNDQFLVLAEEMEERDPHYASVVGQRKRAISLIEPIVTGEGDAVLEAVEGLVEAPIFSAMIDDLLDAPFKGYSCVDPIWSFGETLWQPKAYLHRDPRFFRFDAETGQELRIKDDAYPDGRPIPQYAMIVHRPKLKSGLTLRSGIARLCSWCFMLKSFTMQDWAAFLEVFGMPLRVGKYDKDATPEEKRTLLRAVRDLGSDAAAIIPINMEIEFIEVNGGQGNAVFGAMADYLDKQISKAVVGQTMTTDDGSSLAQASVHADVKIDIMKSDARQLATTLNRDLIAPFVAFNFGPSVPAPIVSFPVEDPEDIKTMSEALATLVPLGLKVSEADVRKKVGFAKPADNEDILAVSEPRAADAQARPRMPAEGDAAASDEDDKTEKTSQQTCPHCGDTHLAASRAAEPTLVDSLAQEGADEWEPDMGPIVAQVLAAANDSKDYEEFIQRLNQMDPATSQLARTLAVQAMKARGDGNLGNE